MSAPNSAPTVNAFSQRFAKIPPYLVMKVNATAAEDAFLYVGKCIADEIERATGSLTQAERGILDFGCGLGRVIAQMVRRAPTVPVTGFDIDPLMLHWSRQLFAENDRVRFTGTTLDFEDGSFDLITVVSVFTHRDVTTDFWLGELHRLLGPSGRAFVTFHDETLFTEMADKNQFPGIAPGTKLKDRYIVGEGTAEGGAAMGTFYTTEHWRGLVDRFFYVDVIAPRGLFGHQSYCVIRPKAVSIDREELLLEYARSVERDLFNLRQQHQTLY